MQRPLQKKDVLEGCFHTVPLAPYLVFTPIILFLLAYQIFALRLPWSLQLGLGVLGAAYWHLQEYLIHRFLFHLRAKTPLGKKLVRLAHLAHHADPARKNIVSAAPLVAFPIAALQFLLIYLIAGPYAYGFCAGHLMGYLYYEYVHYSIHHSEKRFGIFAVQRRHHLYHHSKNPGSDYGVVSPLWDYFFKTHHSLLKRSSV